MGKPVAWGIKVSSYYHTTSFPLSSPQKGSDYNGDKPSHGQASSGLISMELWPVLSPPARKTVRPDKLRLMLQDIVFSRRPPCQPGGLAGPLLSWSCVVDSCPSLPLASGLSSLCDLGSAPLCSLLSPFADNISPILGILISWSLSALFLLCLRYYLRFFQN